MCGPSSHLHHVDVCVAPYQEADFIDTDFSNPVFIAFSPYFLISHPHFQTYETRCTGNLTFPPWVDAAKQSLPTRTSYTSNQSFPPQKIPNDQYCRPCAAGFAVLSLRRSLERPFPFLSSLSFQVTFSCPDSSRTALHHDNMAAPVKQEPPAYDSGPELRGRPETATAISEVFGGSAGPGTSVFTLEQKPDLVHLRRSYARRCFFSFFSFSGLMELLAWWLTQLKSEHRNICPWRWYHRWDCR